MSLLGPATWWGLAAALPAVTAEYLYRLHPQSWVERAWVYIPLAIAINYCVYRLVTIPQTSLIDAFIVFAFATTGLRVFASVVLLGDPVKGGTWFALALLILARVAQTYWGR